MANPEKSFETQYRSGRPLLKRLKDYTAEALVGLIGVATVVGITDLVERGVPIKEPTIVELILIGLGLGATATLATQKVWQTRSNK